MVAPAFVAPALYYNLDWADGASGWDNTWLAFQVVGSAAFVESCRHARTDWQVAVGVLVAGTLMVANAFNAFETMSNTDDHRIDHRKALMVDGQYGSSTRSGWSTTVELADTKVGKKAKAEYNSELQRYIVENAAKWRATQECNPLEITKSQVFCAEVERLRGLVKTAEVRDATKAKIEQFDRAAVGKVTPTNADPFVAGISALLGIFGITPSEEGKNGIRSLKRVSRTIALEALATFGPTLWLLLVDGMTGSAGARRAPSMPKPERAPMKSKSEVAVAPTEALNKPMTKCTLEFLRFCADELEEGSTFAIAATPAFRVWESWCQARGIDPGTQKRFGGMMGEKFKRDHNNGYPRYLGVRARLKGECALSVG